MSAHACVHDFVRPSFLDLVKLCYAVQKALLALRLRCPHVLPKDPGQAVWKVFMVFCFGTDGCHQPSFDSLFEPPDGVETLHRPREVELLQGSGRTAVQPLTQIASLAQSKNTSPP
eukprot:531109-Pyramimonas_sp.AAC.1